MCQNEETLRKVKCLDSRLVSVVDDSSALLIAHGRVELGLAVTLLSCSYKARERLLVVFTLDTF